MDAKNSKKDAKNPTEYQIVKTFYDAEGVTLNSETVLIIVFAMYTI